MRYVSTRGAAPELGFGGGVGEQFWWIGCCIVYTVERFGIRATANGDNTEC